MSQDPPDRAQHHDPPPTIGEIFRAFLTIGATSFGGGVVAYLHNSLVVKHGWLDEQELLELLSISQSLPGLNATNMAVLVGDRLRGSAGAAAAFSGLCLPGAVVMYAAAVAYSANGARPLATAALKGVAAAAVGLILATAMNLGRKALPHRYDLVFVALAVIGVNRLHLGVPIVLIAVGLAAIFWYRPGGRAVTQPPEPEKEMPVE
jgi:chromate transporter